MKQQTKRILYALAIIYAAGMLFLLLARESSGSHAAYSARFWKSINPVPFRTIRLFLRSLRPPYRPANVRHALVNLIGNVVLFIPLGWFPPALWERLRKLWKTLLLCAGVMTVMEILQALLLVGKCDIDDLILNLLGAAIGYGIWRFAHRT